MKLNTDCVRDVLLELESFPLGQYTLKSFSKTVAKYGEETTHYTLTKLAEGKYINAEYVQTMDGRIHLAVVYDLTFAGHEFLSTVRAPGLWEQLKEAASDGGTACIQLIGEVATEILKEQIKRKLGLS